MCRVVGRGEETLRLTASLGPPKIVRRVLLRSLCANATSGSPKFHAMQITRTKIAIVRSGRRKVFMFYAKFFRAQLLVIALFVVSFFRGQSAPFPSTIVLCINIYTKNHYSELGLDIIVRRRKRSNIIIVTTYGYTRIRNAGHAIRTRVYKTIIYIVVAHIIYIYITRVCISFRERDDSPGSGSFATVESLNLFNVYLCGRQKKNVQNYYTGDVWVMRGRAHNNSGVRVHKNGADDWIDAKTRRATLYTICAHLYIL